MVNGELRWQDLSLGQCDMPDLKAVVQSPHSQLTALLLSGEPLALLLTREPLLPSSWRASPSTQLAFRCPL